MTNPFLLQTAKDLYSKSIANHPTIHTNRFPTWEELDQTEQNYWLQMAVVCHFGIGNVSGDTV